MFYHVRFFNGDFLLIFLGKATSRTADGIDLPARELPSFDITELQLHAEQFTNELVYCIKFLCYSQFTKEELDNFSDPLRSVSLLLREMLQDIKSNPGLPFKPLHESTIRLVSTVKGIIIIFLH